MTTGQGSICHHGNALLQRPSCTCFLWPGCPARSCTAARQVQEVAEGEFGDGCVGTHRQPHTAGADLPHHICCPQGLAAFSTATALHGPGTTTTADSEPSTSSPAWASAATAPARSELRGREIEEAAMRKQIAVHEQHPSGLRVPLKWGPGDLVAAFDKCGLVTSEYAKTFYLGTQASAASHHASFFLSGAPLSVLRGRMSYGPGGGGTAGVSPGAL